MSDPLPQTFEITIDDIPALEELDRACFPENRRFTSGYFYLLFLYDEGFGWGLRAGGELVAFILLTPHNNRCNIATIDVLPDFRRRGFARFLMEHAEREMRSHRMAKITLQVETTNEAAISMYETMGFKRVRLLKDYYDGADAFHMEKRLQ